MEVTTRRPARADTTSGSCKWGSSSSSELSVLTEGTESTGQDQHGGTEARRSKNSTRGSEAAPVRRLPLTRGWHSVVVHRKAVSRRLRRGRGENPRWPDRASRGEGHTGIENTSAT